MNYSNGINYLITMILNTIKLATNVDKTTSKIDIYYFVWNVEKY